MFNNIMREQREGRETAETISGLISETYFNNGGHTKFDFDEAVKTEAAPHQLQSSQRQQRMGTW